MFGNSYNPFFSSPYLPEEQFFPGFGFGRPQHDPYAEARARAQAEARARALAEERARRAQWLPEEDGDDEDEDDEYIELGPRERAYLEAMKRRQQLEREEQERQRMLEGQSRSHQQKRKHPKKRAEAANQAQKNGQHQAPSSSPIRRTPPPHEQKQPRSRSTTPIPQQQAPTTPAPQQRAPTPRQPTPPPRQHTPEPQYTEKHEEAASIIQTKYRIHQSFKHIRDLEQTFQDAKKAFTFPTTLDFQRPGAGVDHDPISVHVRSPPPQGNASESPMEVDEREQFPAKLAYTTTNYALHAYMEALLKFLMQLDGVESWGDADVRKRRRAVVKGIEAEVSRVDAYWKNAWTEHLKEEEEKDSQEVDEEVNEESGDDQETEEGEDADEKMQTRGNTTSWDPWGW